VIAASIAPPHSVAGPFAPGYRRLTLGLISAITLVSFEALGVAAAMPAAAEELRGERWYGGAFSLLLLGQLVGTAALGDDIDTRGPRRGFLVGLATLVVGLAVGAAATHISMLLLSRLLVGIGAGAVFTVGYAAVGIGYPESMRPRVNAAVSSAWVFPGLIGPGLAGWMTDTYSWRWALVAVIPLAVAAAIVVVPALPSPPSGSGEMHEHIASEDGDPFWMLSNRRRIAVAVVGAAGTGLALSGMADLNWWPLIVLGVGLLGGACFKGLLPRSALQLRLGFGSTLVVGMLLLGGYSGTEAFVSLALQRLRGLSSRDAGFALTLASLMWFVGSWAHGRRPDLLRHGRNAQLAIASVGAGVISIALLAVPGVPLVLLLAVWGIGATGMGLIYNLISERPFQLVRPEQIGLASIGVQMAYALGGALTTGAGGAVIAALGTADAEGEIRATAAGIVWALMIPLACLIICALIVKRMLADDRPTR
jgi:MFS family permease